MSAGRCVRGIDRNYATAVLALIVLGLAALFDARGRIPLSPDAPISQAYERYAGVGLMTCALLPVYAIGVGGVMKRLGSPARLARYANRQRALAACVKGLMTRSFVFQVIQMSFALAAAISKSGIEHSLADVTVFAIQQLVLGTLWFAVVSLAMLAGRLVWGWGILPVIPGFLYAGYDVLLGMTPLVLEPHLAMGWQLVLSADPSDVSSSVAGAARLTTLAILLAALCFRLSRSVDFLEGGAEDEAS